MKNVMIQQQVFTWIFDNTEDLVIILSQRGEILAINNVALAIYGRHSQTVCGRNFVNLLNDLKTEPIISHSNFQEFLKEQTLKPQEMRIAQGGQSYFIQWSLNHLDNTMKEKPVYIFLGKNLTALRETEKLAKSSQTKFETIISYVPGNVYWLDNNGIYLGCNDNVASTLGLKSRDEICGKTYDDFLDLLDPQYVKSCKQADQEVLTTGQPKLNIEDPPLKDAQGNNVYFQTNRVPIYDENNQIAGLMGISINITDHKKIEESLRQAKDAAEYANQAKLEFLAKLSGEVMGTSHQNRTAEEYVHSIKYHLEGIIACMPGNIYWTDKKCRYMGCNDNVAKMFGFTSRNEIVGRTYDDLAKLGNWSQGQGESFKRDDLEVMTTGKPKLNVEEPPIKDAQGNVIRFLTSRVPIKDKDGHITGVVGISIDITERKKMEDDLLKAKEEAEAGNKAKTEFLENMRHDIRTPLTGIIGFSEIIKSEIDDHRIKEYADNLVASSHALLNFLNEILETVRIASGEIPMLKKKFDLKARLESIINLNQARACEKHLSLELLYDENIPSYLIGDPVRIQRIILELVTNALNFTTKGYIKVCASLAEKEKKDVIIKINVEDTGIGMPTNKQKEIFTRFKRLTPSYEGIYQGAGLGLSVVKQFIDELNGEIYVTSNPDEGSVFICIFPLKEALLGEPLGVEVIENEMTSFRSLASNMTAPQVSEDTDNSLTQILLVEDQPMAVLVARNILSRLKCQVDIAPDGKTAVQKARDYPYDLIFMDIGLPDINGYEVTKRIRLDELNKDRHIPIIALTAHIDEENKQNCIGVGMNAVLSKPLVQEKAQEILDAFIPYRVQEEAKFLKNDVQPNLFALPGKILDIDMAGEIMKGNKNLLREIINMLIEGLPEELDKLNQAYKEGDWEMVGFIAHKLAGSACYCGTQRLKSACLNLKNNLKNKELSDKLFRQLLKEMDAVQKECQKVIHDL
jgi:two-component system aerobic respiration control sensor histidine kinase ArcB